VRDLFVTCSLPEEAKAWVDKIEIEERPRPPYRKILKIIHNEQQKSDQELVEFGIIRAKLRDEYSLNIKQDEVIDLCRALSRFVPQWVTVNSGSVEIKMRPDKILAAVQAVIGEYPEREQLRTDLPA
jgi:hypothetical protein